MRPTDIEHLVVPGDPRLHPDGHRVAYVLTETDLEADRYVRTIHLWDGERNRRFTHGPSDTLPRWSPDGRWLAFLRKGADEDEAQLHVMPADGGEAQRRTSLALGVSDLAWAPDGSRLVVVGSEWVPELADLDADERRRVPKRITRLPYRGDGDGWIHQRRSHLWLVERSGDADATCLTPGDADQHAPSWHPDGTSIAFLSDPTGGSELDPDDAVFRVDLGQGRTDELVGSGSWASVDHAPDGTLYLTGMPDAFDWPAPFAIWRLTDHGLDPVTVHLDASALPGSPPSATRGPVFVDDGFLSVVERRGVTHVVHVALDGWDPADGPPEVGEVVGGRRCVTGFAPRPDGSALAFTSTDPATPGELFWRENGRERCVTDLTRSLRARVDLRPTVRFEIERDGEAIDAWAVLPDGFDESPPGAVPVLLQIHGGPTAQYGEFFFDESQVYAGAGYLVVGSNPRGSSGRGSEWCRAVVGAWTEGGSVDTLDLEAVVDAANARFPQADPTRAGIMGGSYGGFATARLLTRSDRYRSAIVERGLLNWESFAGTSDIGTYFDRMFLGASLPDGVSVHRAASPVADAARITTPTLVLHAERDWRCPIEQSEQFFVALRRAGVPAEFVRFPDEGHELSRSGTPKHRVERFEAILDWHRRHLLG